MTILHPWRDIRPWKRHSLVLVVAGTVYILIGMSFITTESNPTREVALQFALLWIPIEGWGVVFIFSGLLAILSARWPPVSETWGYTVLTGLSAGWAAFYSVGITFGDSPPANGAAVMVWGLMAFLWWAISGLMNPEEPYRHAFRVIVSSVDGVYTPKEFAKLGGPPIVYRAVQILYDKVMADPQLSHYFEGIDMDHLRRQQAKMFLALLGARSFETVDLGLVHVDYDISEDEFSKMMYYLAASFDEVGMSLIDSQKLIDKVRVYKPQIVKE